jgi:hypothetical protein
VTDTRGRQGAVEADFYSSNVNDQPLVNQRLGEGRSGTHRTNCMGAGWTDADFEEIENTDSHAKAYSCNGR